VLTLVSSRHDGVSLMTAAALPFVIQGGMGIAVSNWRLARAVSAAGHLGVVSGTALDSVFVRRLQDGDACGAVRRALAHFPLPEVASEILKRYWRPEGRAADEPYRLLPMYRQAMGVFREQVTIAANFVEVWLAKEGHSGPVGINLLTKVQMPTLPSLYGAMLAGVDVVLMGAGIPREIPGALEALSRHAPASLKLDVDDEVPGGTASVSLDPGRFGYTHMQLKRPIFLAIVSAHTLATNLARKATGPVDGFVVEGAVAGGHNAPPRGALRLNERGEPIYGERDVTDLGAMRELGLPFWLAGGFGTPEGVREARAAGAAGVQVGTLFAYSDESGIAPDIKRTVLRGVAKGQVDVFTDPRASPTGFPFKIVRAPGLQEQDDTRIRCCDLGYLRTAYRMESGKLGYHCPAAPLDGWADSGGALTATTGRRCLCNGLMSVIGLAQPLEDGTVEPPVLTSGDAVAEVARVARGRESYTAVEALNYLLGVT
jgi:NAD(P)H-dependent flavin oxidoreductase YrpB (nitropropane dioxygenase family)